MWRDMSTCVLPVCSMKPNLKSDFTVLILLVFSCLSPLISWVRISIKARCTTLYDKVCQWLTTGRWFPPGSPDSSTNKTDHHDITEILLKVALSNIKQTCNCNIAQFAISNSLNFSWQITSEIEILIIMYVTYQNEISNNVFGHTYIPWYWDFA